MRIQILRQADYTVSAWAGGVTTQLAIWPPQAQYAARSFDWRVSSAVVGAEESVFTRLPDYARHLAILDGQLRLRHNGGGELTLHPFTPHVFDGADETRSCGTCTDFNLMLRKGICEGLLQAKILAQGERWSGCYRESSVRSTYFVYCFQGCLTVCHPGCPDQSLEAGEGLQIDRKAGEEELSWRLDNPSEEKEAVVVIAEIFQK